MTVNGNGTAPSEFTPIKKCFVTPVMPFLDDGAVDYVGYRALIAKFTTDEMIANGMAVIANPEAGELFTLEPEERRAALTICLEEAAGRCPVFAGCVHVSTKGYVEIAKEAYEMGAKGLFVFPPIGSLDITMAWDSEKYPEVFVDILLEIAKEVPLPMIIHPVGKLNPAYGHGFGVGTIKKILDAVPNVVGWKMIYHYAGFTTVGRFLRSYKRPVAILGASAVYFHEFNSIQMFDGTCTGSWNYALEPMMEHLKLWRQEDWKGATALWNSGLAQLHKYIYSDHGRLHVRYKVAAWLAGMIPSPIMRPPMPKPRLEEIDDLKTLLQNGNMPLISDKDINSIVQVHGLVL